MGVGFYLMIATAIIMYKIAESDKRRGWLWFGITLCVTMVLGKVTGLGIPSVFMGFFITFVAMFISNMRSMPGR